MLRFFSFLVEVFELEMVFLIWFFIVLSVLIKCVVVEFVFILIMVLGWIYWSVVYFIVFFNLFCVMIVLFVVWNFICIIYKKSDLDFVGKLCG